MPAARIVLYSATFGAFGVLLRTLTRGPLPLWLVVSLMTLYLAVIAVGILAPQLEMFGDAIVEGPPGTRRVALTFDDGPHPGTTHAILDLLAQEGDRATFFVIGERVDRHPEVVRQIVTAGHTVGVHGYRHAWSHSLWSPGAIAADIERARDAVERAAGVRPRYFRPPIGIVSPRTAVGAGRARAPIVLFSLRSWDGVIPKATSVAQRVTTRLRDGSIVLLHDAAERTDRCPASIEALPVILAKIRTMGLATVGVEAFVDDEPLARPSLGGIG
ncbi:MAG: polysaccharide deacetylase family protein [Polyangiaceae bacterium]|nr:polysaccharide deacetylase family protein [Polyangiaceae bacterium]